MDITPETATTWLDVVGGGGSALTIVLLLAILWWINRRINETVGMIKQYAPEALKIYGQYTHQLEKMNEALQESEKREERFIKAVERCENANR